MGGQRRIVVKHTFFDLESRTNAVEAALLLRRISSDPSLWQSSQKFDALVEVGDDDDAFDEVDCGMVLPVFGDAEGDAQTLDSSGGTSPELPASSARERRNEVSQDEDFCDRPDVVDISQGTGVDKRAAVPFSATALSATAWPHECQQFLERMESTNERLTFENTMLRQQVLTAQVGDLVRFMPVLGVYPAAPVLQEKRCGPVKGRGPIMPEPVKTMPKTWCDEPRTTVMLRNMPNNYNRAMVLELLDSEGFRGQYDFVYLPIDFKSEVALGYAFINFVSSTAALAFWSRFDGYSNWAIPSRKVSGVSWSEPHQGLEANIERYRNSSIMAKSVPDEYKPILLIDGVRMPFPVPTRRVQAPRLRVKNV